MRTSKETFSLLGLLALLADPSAQLAGVPIGTGFTYHGRLTDGGAPATGAHDFYCLVYDAETGGSPVGDSVRRDAVVVSEGVFLLELDFGPDAFAGEARWLEIQVRPSGPDPYTTLSPRQPISPTPYALYASTAGLAAQATTALGVADHSVTGAGIADGTITRADLGRNIVWMAGGNAGTEPDTHFLGTVDAQPLSVRVSNEEAARFTTDGNLGLGTATPTQKLDVAGSIAYSGQLTKLDVAENQAATVRAADFQFGHSMRRGGPGLALVDWGEALQLNYDGWSSTWLGGTTVVDPEDANDGVLMPGLAFGQNSGEGIASRRAEGENRWGLDFYTDGASRLSVANNGNVGIGTRSPQFNLDVAGPANLNKGLTGVALRVDGAEALWFDGAYFSWGYGGTGNYFADNVGIGTSNPQERLHVQGRARFDPGSGQVNVSTPRGWPGLIAFTSNGHRRDVAFADWCLSLSASPSSSVPPEENSLSVYENGNVGIGTTTTSVPGKLTVRGNILVQSASTGASVLELGEGLDYAEGFDVSEGEAISPGSVLIIDADRPGRLALSSRAYDRKVAGIAAGGKGLGSGVRLGAGEFDCDVALAGRVYCNVDTTAIGVEPGDLLTTSDVPGHAMKATDSLRSQGAILGKAMEGMERGTRGQILVLVTLQ